MSGTHLCSATCWVGLLVAASPLVSAKPTYSLWAVKINDQQILLSSQIIVKPGDQIETVIFASEWSPQEQRLAAYKVDIDGRGFVSGDTGSVLPLGWDFSCNQLECATGSDCGEGCDCHDGLCKGPDWTVALPPFTTSISPNYIFYDCQIISEPPPTPKPDWYTYSDSCFLESAQPIYEFSRSYIGTLIFQVSNDARGVFTIGFDPKESFFIDSTNDHIEPVSLEPLTITIDAPPPPTFEVKAVKVNDVDILPTSQLTIDPGDIVEVNIFGSNWSPESQILTTYQVYIDCSGFTNEGSRVAMLDRKICDLLSCRNIGAFIDEDREDYVFWAFTPITLTGIDISDCIRWGALINGSIISPFYYQGIPKYFGTLTLETFLDSCGSFQIDLLRSVDPDPNDPDATLVVRTEMHNYNNEPIRPLKIVPLSLTISTKCSCPLVFDSALQQPLSTPPNCAIDARDPDLVPNPGWRVFSIPLRTETDCRPPDLDLFELNEFPLTTQNTPNSIIDVGANLDLVSVLLRDSIQPGRWTCLNYHGSAGGTTCLSRLPGDVNNDSTVQTSDVNHIMKCLSGEDSCNRFQCDMDHNNTCSPQDLLHLIDLMNGADGREVLLGTEIADELTCPSQVP